MNNRISCVNGYKYGYKYGLHLVLTECYQNKKHIFLAISSYKKIYEQIALWQSYNNKYLDRNLITLFKYNSVHEVYNNICGGLLHKENKKLETGLIVFFDNFYSGVGQAFINLTKDYAAYIFNLHHNFIKNNSKCDVIFINNIDFDPDIANYLKEKVDYFLDCTISKNVLGCKINDLIFYYEYKKLKGGQKVIGNIICDPNAME